MHDLLQHRAAIHTKCWRVILGMDWRTAIDRYAMHAHLSDSLSAEMAGPAASMRAAIPATAACATRLGFCSCRSEAWACLACECFWTQQHVQAASAPRLLHAYSTLTREPDRNMLLMDDAGGTAGQLRCLPLLHIFRFQNQEARTGLPGDHISQISVRIVIGGAHVSK